MKHPHLIILLALAVPSLGFAKDTDASGDVEQAVIKIEQELVDALLKGDTSAGERYMADKFVFVAPDGEVQRKSDFISDVKGGKLKMESSKNSDVKVVAADADMAVVTYKSVDKGTYDGRDISGEYRWMDVFMKRNGNWQIVASQGTEIVKR